MFVRYKAVLLVAGGLLFSGAASALYLKVAGGYYGSIDSFVDIFKLSGYYLKGNTAIETTVIPTEGSTLCLNPAGNQVNGVGHVNPSITFFGTSTPIGDGDLVKGEGKVKGNIYLKTVSADLSFSSLADQKWCWKNDTSPGTWKQTYWNYRMCDADRTDSAKEDCYQFAYFDDNGDLLYVSNGQAVTSECEKTAPGCTPEKRYPNWALTFFPDQFKLTAVAIDVTDPENPTLIPNTETTVNCNWDANMQSGALWPGSPFSLVNPPVGEDGVYSFAQVLARKATFSCN